jgi:hypothetical protein
MRVGVGLDERRTTFCESPARGGVDDEDVGLARPARRARACQADVAAAKRALVISLSRAFWIASATAASTISTPATSRARGAIVRAIVRSAEQVEDALVAAQLRVLDRDAVEALAHLGVGLEERLGRDAEA